MIPFRTKNLLGNPHILVISLDFDGCIFNVDYLRSTSPNRLIECNEKLIKHLTERIEAEEFERVIFLTSSNRQAKEIDDLNCFRGKSESSYTALLKICDEVNRRTKTPCKVDRFLLADAYGNKPAGENFSKAVAGEEYAYSHYIWDEYKYSILYGHTHKIASENRDADITQLFFDDKDDILHHLSHFSNTHSSLIPDNVRLQFYRYNGRELVPHYMENKTVTFRETYGAGVKDSNYARNIQMMARACGFNPEDGNNHSRPLKGISEHILKTVVISEFIQERLLTINDLLFEIKYESARLKRKLTHSAKHPFFAALDNLCRRIAADIHHPEMREEINKLCKDMLQLLRAMQQDHVLSNFHFNHHRQEKINHFIDHYGQPLNGLKAVARTVTNSIYGLFYSPSDMHKLAFILAESLKPLLSSDEREVEKVKLHNTIMHHQ